MQVNDYVTWKWIGGTAHGQIAEMHGHHMELKVEGKTITRNGSNEDPALVINHDKGHQVLKLAHEVEVVEE